MCLYFHPICILLKSLGENVLPGNVGNLLRLGYFAEMAHELMVVLRKSGIDFIVAPYEADSQLAFLTQVFEPIPCT